MPRMIGNGSKVSFAPATPNTLAKLEDPRAWHARGEMGIIKPKKSPAQQSAAMIAMPMAPPVPNGRPIPVVKKVLQEEDYVERLGDIIESDYFPHNSKMSRALAGLGGAAAGVTPNGGFIGTPSSARFSTPGGSTPGAGGGEGGDEMSTRKPNKRMPGSCGSLTKFVATHTSEDNQAFTELQEKDQEAFRRRYFWAYDSSDQGQGTNSTATKLLILPTGQMMSVERREQMDAACADRPKIGDHRPNQVETWKHRTRNQLMFLPTMAGSNNTCRIEDGLDSVASVQLESTSTMQIQPSQPALTKQSKLVDRQSSDRVEAIATRSGADNDTSTTTISPLPSPAQEPSASTKAGNDEGLAERLQKKQALRKDISNTPEDLPSPEKSEPTRSDAEAKAAEAFAVRRPTLIVKNNPKVIQAHATRFPVPKARLRRAGAWTSPIESPSSSRESVKDLLVGTGDGETQEYSEVPMTPSRVPGVDGDSPQITWGSIDGTPMILDPRMTPLPDGSLPGTMSAVDLASVSATLGAAGAGGGRHFEIKDLPARDKLAHHLEAHDTRRKRARPGGLSGADSDRATDLRTPGSTRTPLNSRTPSTGPTAGSGSASGAGRRRQSSSKSGGLASPAPAALTPAGRTLAAKLANRRSGDTPFGGALTPGPQKRRRHRSTRGSIGEGSTPLPGTPGGTPVAGALPMAGVVGRLRQTGVEEKTKSSLTDGLLALK